MSKRTKAQQRKAQARKKSNAPSSLVATSTDSIQQEIQILEWRQRLRWARWRDRVGIILYYLSLYIMGFGSEYIVVSLMFWAIEDSIGKYLWVKIASEWLAVGFSFSAMIGGLVHGVFSLLGQMRMDYQQSREDS